MTLEIKAIIAAVVLALAAAIGWVAYHEYEAHLTDQSKIGQQSQVIADQKNTINQQASSAAVTDTVVASSVQGDQSAQATQSKIDAWVADQTKQINDKYANPASAVVAPAVASGVVVTKPAAPVNHATVTADKAGDVVPTGQEAEVISVQLTGSWMKYCQAVGDADPKCATVPKPQ